VDATPLNVIALLVVSLAAAAVIALLRKHYDSNLPLLFYFAAIALTTMSDRNVNPYLLYPGLAVALLLRFEFLNKSFTKFIGFMATVTLCGIIWVLLAEVFGDGTAPF